MEKPPKVTVTFEPAGQVRGWYLPRDPSIPVLRVLGQFRYEPALECLPDETMEQALEIIIGHEAMVATLPGGFPTAGLAVLDFDQVASLWRLTDFLID